MVTVKLFNGDKILAADIAQPFSRVVADCKERLKDEKLTQENFGVLRYFFFRRGSTMIEDNGFFIPQYTLEKMRVKDGDVLELCYVPNSVKK
jgi:hypothetical protein